MSESDFMDITRNGTLCNADGEIGTEEFETSMRKEVTTYLQTRLTDFSEFRTSEDIEFNQLGAVKTILSGVLILIEEQRAARQEIKETLEQMKRSPPVSPTPQASPLPLGENGIGSNTTTRTFGTHAAKTMDAGMEALVAELVGVKAVIQEHVAELRRTIQIPQAAQRPPVSPSANSISLEAAINERRRRAPRRDWGSFVLAGAGSGRNTASSSAAASPAATAGNLVRGISASNLNIPENHIDAAGRLASQGCVPWSSLDSSKANPVSAVATAPASRRDSRDGGMRMGKKATAVAPDKSQRQSATALASTPMEISVPMLLAADSSDISSKAQYLQLTEPAARTNDSTASDVAVPHVHSYLPAATAETATLAESPAFKGASKHRQAEVEVVLVPSPAVRWSPAGVYNGGGPSHGSYGPEQPLLSDAAAGGCSMTGVGIAEPEDDGVVTAASQQRQ